MKAPVRSFTTTPQLIDEAAQYWASRIGGSQTPLIALCGGRSAQPLFQSFARLHPALETAHFFWADERCVPADHPESNFAIASRSLFEPLRVPEHQIHRIRGELEPATAAREAEHELRSTAGKPLPALDLVILSMGEDGHIASLFPGQASPEDQLFHAVVAPKPPAHRVTMSYRLLKEARHILALVSGPAKAAALRRSLDPGDTPLGRLIGVRAQTEVWCDFSL